MENKLFLIVHKYLLIEPAVYLAKKNDALWLMKETKGCEKFMFEFDLEKIRSVLKEVEVKIIPKNENI